MVHCPRCVARTRTPVELFASTLPGERLYSDAAPADAATRRHTTARNTRDRDHDRVLDADR
jgi:hypothetical protein